jgi:outer membrane protein assembly factor BamE
MRHFFNLRYLPLVFVLLCTACGTALPTVKPYKLDVQQGNVVTSKMLLQLRPGMTKSQVRFIMGTPLVQDSFHGNRWDYVYQLREKGKIVEQRRVILDFENELLKSVRGDVIPAGSGPKEAEPANTSPRTIKPVEKAKEKGLMDRLKFWKKDEVAPAVVPPAGSDSKTEQATPAPEPIPAPAPAPEAAPASQTETPPASHDQSPASSEQAPAAEESKSLLSVPMEVPLAPVESAPASQPEAPAEPTPPAPAPSVSEPAKAPSQGAPAQDVPAQEAPAKEPTANPPAESNVPYEPSSGMQFDRDLTLENDAQPKEAAPQEPKPAAPAPRAGNKEVPAPKDLPAEGEPDFFEKMLEKIGF